MKKLLFILEHLNVGGVERSTVDILNNLDYSEYEVDLLLYQGKGDYETEIPPQVNIVYYPTEDAFGRITTVLFNALRKRDWFSIRFRFCYSMEQRFGGGYMKRAGKLFHQLDKEYDCAISCRPGLINNSLLVYSFKSKKKIVWWHHGELGMSEKERMQLDALYAHIDYMVAVSESSKRIVTEHFCLDDEKIKVIPNMIIIDRLMRRANEYVVPKKEDQLILCSVGRFSNEKNMLICPEIGKILKQKGIKFVWYMIGDGNQLDEAKERVASMKLNHNFCFTGSIKNPYPYVATADVFVHPSWIESQGIAVLESMALRTPVVVVDSGGPREYIKSGENGYLVNNDADEICDAVQKLIDRKDKNKTLIENAYQTALRYSPEKIVSKLDDLFTV